LRQELNLDSKKSSFEYIQTKFNEINYTTNTETKNIGIIIQNTLNEIERKKKDL